MLKGKIEILTTMNEIVGIIIPIPKELIDRLLNEKRNVVVKYVNKNAYSKLSEKNRVLFYQSRSLKQIVGEGRIDEIYSLTPKEALDKFGNKLFIDANELGTYISRQPNRMPTKKMLVFVLSRLTRYPEPKKFKKPISMAGQYVTKEQYEELLEARIKVPSYPRVTGR
jgi:hypothetical protein